MPLFSALVACVSELFGRRPKRIIVVLDTGKSITIDLTPPEPLAVAKPAAGDTLGDPSAGTITDATATGPPTHAPGFASVHWGEVVYHFTPKQRAVIAVLWEAWLAGAPCVDAGTLLAVAGTDGVRLRDVFGHGRHPAWGTLVVQGALHGGRAGTWRLAPLPGG